MRLKIDENLHDEVAALLAADGHDVHTVHSEGLRGGDDATLAQHCRGEGRALVSLDLDFADIRAYPPASHSGMIVLRVGNQSRRHILNVMGQALDLLKREPVAGRLSTRRTQWKTESRIHDDEFDLSFSSVISVVNRISRAARLFYPNIPSKSRI